MTTLGPTRFWVGASTSGDSGSPARGIRPLDVDVSGAVHLGNPTDVGPNPMYLAWRDNQVFGVVHQLIEGYVSTWRLDDTDPDRPVRYCDTAAADGHPCHLTFDESGEWIVAANYTGGSITAHPCRRGTRPRPSNRVLFHGGGPNPARQEAAHPHQAVNDTARGRLLVPDLGSDLVRVVNFDGLSGEFSAGMPIRVRRGAGPRHLVIDGDLAVVANELDRTLSVLDLVTDIEVSAVCIGEDRSRLALGFSAVRMTSSGTLLVADRDADALHALHLDRSARSLDLVATVATGGRHPRDLQLTHDERHVLVANYASDSVVVMPIDEAGVPTQVVERLTTESPACLSRVPRAAENFHRRTTTGGLDVRRLARP